MEGLRVFFQDVGLLIGYNFGLISALTQYEDLELTVGASTWELYRKSKQLARKNKHLNVCTAELLLRSRKILGDSVSNFLSPIYKKMMSGIDLVHMNQLQHPCKPVVVVKPKVLTFHDPYLPVENQSKILWEMNLISKFDMLVAPSQFIAKVIHEKLGYQPTVICHGVDTTLFNSEIDKEKARRRLGLPKDHNIIFWNGRLDWEKDPKALIDAIPLVVKEVPHSLFVIKGRGGSNHAKRVLNYARKKLKETRTEENTIFLRKLIPYEKIPDFYRSSDIFVHTARLESFGLVLVEAMACGVPIVAADAATAPEIVGDAGILFEPGNPEDLARKAIRLLNDEKLKTKMGTIAKKRIVQCGFTWETAAKHYRNLYLSLSRKN